jgi:Na+/melibiose symporter-like transporter
MGRLKIKKKEAVIPFRETLAYRMMLVAASIVAFVVAMFVLAGATTVAGATFISAAAIGVAAAVATFYNLNHLRHARVPQRTLKRMRRR